MIYMKQKLMINSLKAFIISMVLAIGFSACNKDLQNATPILYPRNGDTTVFGLLNRDTSLSFYRAAVTRVGLNSLLNNDSERLTVFIPNNDAFRASGITSIGLINILPIATVGGIVQYSIIPGEQFVDTITSVTTAFPNVQLPSYITIATIPGTAIPINLPLFPSKRPTGFWINNIPMVASNLLATNGIVHKVARIVAPPNQVLAQLLGNDPNESLFNALIARGDSGQTGLNAISNALAFPIANLTLFAPTNAAMKAFINAISGIPVVAPDAVFIGFINNFLPVQSARGIVVYHLMPYRAFSVNFPTTGAFFPTLLNGAIPAHPGVKVQATFIGGFGVALQVTGAGNGGNPALSTAPTNLDKNAVNGVEHIIDRVLLPQ